MPSRRRHPSIAVGSGPVSTTTPAPPPSGSTRPSPCPTSHDHEQRAAPAASRRATTRPARTADQRATSADDGDHPSRPVPQREQADRRVRRPAAARPTTPLGHGTGRVRAPPPRASATNSSHRAGQLASQATERGTAPARSATAPPRRRRRSWPPARPASASRFAGTAMRLTVPASPAISGEQATCAAAGTATASASGPASPGPAAPSRQCGAISSRPAVAQTDRPKPTSVASAGS